MNGIVTVSRGKESTAMKTFTIDTDNNITVHSSRKAARDTGAGVFASEQQLAELIGPDNQRLVEIWNSLPGVKPVIKFANRKVATERIWKAIQDLGEPPAVALDAAAQEHETGTHTPAAELPAEETTLASTPSALPTETALTHAAVDPFLLPGPQPSPVVEHLAHLGDAILTQAAPTELSADPTHADADAARPREDVTLQGEIEPVALTPPYLGELEPVARIGTSQPQGATLDAGTLNPSRAEKAVKAKKASQSADTTGPRVGSKTAQVVALLRRHNGATLEEIMQKMGWQRHTVRGFIAGAMKKAGYAVESFKSEQGERAYRIRS
jgi:hypothetical protein